MLSIKRNNRAYSDYIEIRSEIEEKAYDDCILNVNKCNRKIITLREEIELIENKYGKRTIEDCLREEFNWQEKDDEDLTYSSDEETDVSSLSMGSEELHIQPEIKKISLE